jgi:hypothetical protein
VLLNVCPPGVDHGGLGGILVSTEVEASGPGVVVDRLLDLARSQLGEGTPVEVELLPLVDLDQVVDHLFA